MLKTTAVLQYAKEIMNTRVYFIRRILYLIPVDVYKEYLLLDRVNRHGDNKRFAGFKVPAVPCNLDNMLLEQGCRDGIFYLDLYVFSKVSSIIPISY